MAMELAGVNGQILDERDGRRRSARTSSEEKIWHRASSMGAPTLVRTHFGRSTAASSARWWAAFGRALIGDVQGGQLPTGQVVGVLQFDCQLRARLGPEAIQASSENTSGPHHRKPAWAAAAS